MERIPGSDRVQYVLCGAEAHVCVMQSALDLAEDGKEVFVVADAVGSRRVYDRDVALVRMRDEGVRIVTREMVAFEWLREAGTPLFRDVNKTFLR
jgi:nicotinamidase-related amidase